MVVNDNLRTYGRYHGRAEVKGAPEVKPRVVGLLIVGFEAACLVQSVQRTPLTLIKYVRISRGWAFSLLESLNVCCFQE